MIEGQTEFFPLPVKQAEVEMRLRVIGTQLDGPKQMLLRVFDLSLLEQNQAEVGVKNEDAGILARQPSIDHFRLGIRIRLEVDETEEVEDVGVIRTQLLRTLQFPPGLGIAPVLKRFAPAVVMEKKNALIKGRVQRRFRHRK